jgi:ribosomal protein S18 acetylase RimI-like enzyme
VSPANPEFAIRRAALDDVATIARHRAAMFLEMGRMPAALRDELTEATMRYLNAAIPGGEYVGWLVSEAASPREIVAGAGVQRRRILPHPMGQGDEVSLARGEQGIVLNVYTEPAWRRRGLAQLLMREILTWAGASGLETLVLHASDAGRALYEGLGFIGTNEMRFPGRLS